MKNWKKLITIVCAFAMLYTVTACGKQAEQDRAIPEDTTEVTTTAEEGETTAGEETTTAAETTQTTASEEDATAETTTTATGETTDAASETAAETEAQTDAPAQGNDQPAPAQTPAAQATEPAPAATEAPVQNNNAPEMSFTAGGMTVNVGESAQAFVSGVGYNNFESSPSCLGNGEDINYYYNDYTLYVWNNNDSYQLVGIDISGAGVSTSRGITIGSSAQDVLAAYGNDYTEEGSDFVYRYGNNCSLRFTLNDGSVTYISYNQDN